MTSPELDKAEAKGLAAALREWAGSYVEGSFDTEEGLMTEAADEITRLSSELAAELGIKERWRQLAYQHEQTILDLRSELAASRERERALERERSQLAADIAGSQAAFAEERRDREAAGAEVKRLREATIEECIAVVDAFKDSEDVNALAAVAESKGVKSPGWIKDAMHSHAGELAGKITSAIRALADANTQGGDNG